MFGKKSISALLEKSFPLGTDHTLIFNDLNCGMFSVIVKQYFTNTQIKTQACTAYRLFSVNLVAHLKFNLKSAKSAIVIKLT